MLIYEYADARGDGAISRWMRRELGTVQRARLAEKIDRLSDADPRLQPSFVRGPIAGHIYKLHVTAGRVAMRPLLCKGPIDMKNEWTLLLPAVEQGGKLLPADAITEANRRRAQVAADPRNRRRRYEEPD